MSTRNVICLFVCLCRYIYSICSKCPPPERMHPSERLLHTRPTFSETVMVSVGVSKLGCTDLFFVESGVTINGAYYCDVLLTQNLLPVIRQISGNEFLFQQDSAPAHVLVRQLSSYVERRTGLYFSGTVATEQSRS